MKQFTKGQTVFCVDNNDIVKCVYISCNNEIWHVVDHPSLAGISYECIESDIFETEIEAVKALIQRKSDEIIECSNRQQSAKNEKVELENRFYSLVNGGVKYAIGQTVYRVHDWNVLSQKISRVFWACGDNYEKEPHYSFEEFEDSAFAVSEKFLYGDKLEAIEALKLQIKEKVTELDALKSAFTEQLKELEKCY